MEKGKGYVFLGRGGAMWPGDPLSRGEKQGLHPLRSRTKGAASLVRQGRVRGRLLTRLKDKRRAIPWKGGSFDYLGKATQERVSIN